MSDEDKEDFLRRWSRLKRESAAPPPVKKAEAETAVPLPPLDSLTFESDFKAFMHAKVEEGVKRAALKKLFSDPRFNVMDGLDTYIDDYTKSDTIPAEMLARLERAREKLFNEAAQKANTQAEEPARQHEDPTRQDEDPTQQHEDPTQQHEDPTRQDESPAQTAKHDVDPAQDPKAL